MTFVVLASLWMFFRMVVWRPHMAPSVYVPDSFSHTVTFFVTTFAQ